MGSVLGTYLILGELLALSIANGRVINASSAEVSRVHGRMRWWIPYMGIVGVVALWPVFAAVALHALFRKR